MQLLFLEYYPFRSCSDVTILTTLSVHIIISGSMTSSLFYLFEEQGAERGENQTSLTLPSKASGPLLLARALLLKAQTPLQYNRKPMFELKSMGDV